MSDVMSDMREKLMRDRNFSLAGRRAVVTGGGRGLGFAIASGLAAHGAGVTIAGRSEDVLARAVGEIEAAGGAADFCVADVSKEDDVAALCDHVVGAHERADILVNNAGINPYFKPPERTSLAEWREIIDVNLTGVFLCARVFGEHMIARGSGSIINISSVAGRVGLSRTTAYCAAKGGVELMTRSLAFDWAKYNVRVNAVAPGYFETDLTAGLRRNPGLAKMVEDRTPLERFGRLGEIAGAVIFLASDAASYVTGQTVGVDGGWTAV